MANEVVELKSADSGWSSTQVYVMATICLVLGLIVGFLFRGSQTKSSAPSVSNTPASAQIGMPQQMPSLEQMKHMADKQAEPLLAQLKSDPKNVEVLKKVAKIYASTHQFQEAVSYYAKVLEIDSKDVSTRTEMASCLYYNGDVDGALAQLQHALQDKPKDANSLFNLGMIRWQGKNDSQGAISAWQQLLEQNPKLESQKRSQVQKLIAEVRGQTSLPQEAKKNVKE